MPKLRQQEEIHQDLVVGVVTSAAGVQTWYARCYWRTEKKPFYKSTKIRFEGSNADRQAAIKKARAIYDEFYGKVKRGLSPTASHTLRDTLRTYIEARRIEAAENDERISAGLEPASTKYGRGYLDKTSIEDVIKQTNVIKLFFEDVEFFKEKQLISSSSKPLLDRDIGYIENRVVNLFPEWASKQPERWSPSRIAKFISRIQHIWRLARDDGLTLIVATPQRPKQRLKERARRHLKEEEYSRIIKFANDKWKSIKSEIPIEIKTLKDKSKQNNLDSAFQFYAFLMLISYSGIRPWNGSVDKNLPRWQDYQIIDRGKGYGKGELRTLKRNEKDHRYNAIIMPEAWAVLDALEELHTKRGIYRKDGYMFAHTRPWGEKRPKGSPILEFRKQFESMIKALDEETRKRTDIYASEKKYLYLDGKSPVEKIVPYSLRGYFISCRLRYGEMSVDKIAQACGTSAEMIRITYNDFIVEKEFDLLTSGTQFKETIKIEV